MEFLRREYTNVTIVKDVLLQKNVTMHHFNVKINLHMKVHRFKQTKNYTSRLIGSPPACGIPYSREI